MFKVPEKYRMTKGPMVSDSSYGNNGAFKIPMKDDFTAFVLAADGAGWEHVSVHVVQVGDKKPLTPVWEEMCEIKDMFWDEEDCVVQFHPPKSEYVNNHENVLHLWRHIGKEITLPDSILVGVKKKG